MAVLRWLMGITQERMILRWGIGAPGATGVLGCEVVDIVITSSYYQTVDGRSMPQRLLQLTLQGGWHCKKWRPENRWRGR
jgi:hypothetical protein